MGRERRQNLRIAALIAGLALLAPAAGGAKLPAAAGAKPPAPPQFQRVELDERAEPEFDERTDKRARLIERLLRRLEYLRSKGKLKAAQRIVLKLIKMGVPVPEPKQPPLVIDSFTFDKLAFTINAPGSLSAKPTSTGFTRQFTAEGTNKYSGGIAVVINLYYTVIGSGQVYQFTLTMDPVSVGSRTVYFPLDIVVQQVDLAASAT